MNAVLIVELDDDINLEDVEINYIVQDKYGNPIKAEVDGVKLRPLPIPKDERITDIRSYSLGWLDCLYTMRGVTRDW